MIKEIVQLLKANDFYNCSDIIEVAKGRYKSPENIKEAVKLAIRGIKWQLKKQ